MRESVARTIVRRLRNAGYEALFAGGCVRDSLMGKTPHDFDIATSARPDQVQALFPRTVPVGAQFGVILVVEQGRGISGRDLPLRRRVPRRPPSPECDVHKRRGGRAAQGFTVNGLFYDPIAERVLDFVEGRKDLETRTLRAIGNPAARFSEDKLRLLRGVRFACTLDFEIEAATWDAIRAAAPSIRDVSAERVRDELVKIFASPQRVRGFDLLDASGLMAEVLPESRLSKAANNRRNFIPRGTSLSIRVSCSPSFPSMSRCLSPSPCFFTIWASRRPWNAMERVAFVSTATSQ